MLTKLQNQKYEPNTLPLSQNPKGCSPLQDTVTKTQYNNSIYNSQYNNYYNN